MWLTRKKTPPSTPLTITARDEAREALAEVRAMQEPVRAQYGRLIVLGHSLSGIRDENHFSLKIFGEP